MRRDGHRQLVAGKQDARALFIRENQVFFQLAECGDPVLELPLRRIPIRLGNKLILPVAWSVGAELLFGQKLDGGHFRGR